MSKSHSSPQRPAASAKTSVRSLFFVTALRLWTSQTKCYFGQDPAPWDPSPRFLLTLALDSLQIGQTRGCLGSERGSWVVAFKHFQQGITIRCTKFGWQTQGAQQGQLLGTCRGRQFFTRTLLPKRAEVSTCGRCQAFRIVQVFERIQLQLG